MKHEPPVRTSTDDIVASGRRQRSRRRLGMVGVGAVTLVAAGLVAAATVGLPHFADADIPADNPTPPAENDDRYPVVADWDEYSQVVRDLFVEQGPDYQYNPNEGDAQPFILDEYGEVQSDDPNYHYEIATTGVAFLKTADGQPVGSVSVSLFEPGGWSKDPSYDEFDHYGSSIVGDGEPIVSCWEGSVDMGSDDPDAPTRKYVTETTCEDTSTTNGDRMILKSSSDRYEGEDPESYSNTVVIYRSDDTAVVVDSFCGSADEDDEYGGTCHDIQFDLEQLTAIAEALPKVIVTDDGH